jgi:hypothetical protein
MVQNPGGFVRFQPPNTTNIHLHSFKTITRFPFYSPSFSQLLRLIFIFLFKKLVGISIFKIELKREPNDLTLHFESERRK